jgi:monoamine oxidase
LFLGYGIRHLITAIIIPKTSLYSKHMILDSFQIGIAGAGIAGLVAGTELQRSGHAVTIFESRSRTGGRIRSLEVAGFLVESGPEFIHGNLNGTIGLLKRYNIPYEPVHGKMYHARSGNLRESYEMAEGWELMLDKMKSLVTDLPLQEFLVNYFPGNRHHALRESAIRFAEGFDLADVNNASTRALMAEWELEDAEQYRIPAGYGKLIHSLEREFISLGGKLYLNLGVKTVDWNSGIIRIHVTDHQVFHVDRLISCLPLPALSRTAPPAEIVNFFPALEDKQKAFSQIGFGTVIKIILIWETAFWKPLVPDALFIFSDEFIPTWWTQYPMDIPMLTGWFGGPPAAQVSDKPDDFFLDKAMESLSSVFSVRAEELKRGLKEYRIFNWKNESWSRGAYSYSLVGSEDAKKICRKPVQNRIYFAGEAFYNGPYPGTVEAAVMSALETSGQLLKEITEK